MGALASFVVSAVSIRTLAAHFNVFEINVVRTGGGLALLVAALIASPSLRGLVDITELPRHIPRNLVHSLGGLLWTLAISCLPLATVFSLEFTSPAWAALLAFPIIGERIRRDTLIGIAASLVGVLIVLRPSPASFHLTALLPLGAALCIGLSALLTRRLTRTQSIFAILFWMMVIQLALNLVGASILARVSSGAPSLSPDISTLTMVAMAALAIAGLCSQLCLSKALQIAEASIVLPLDFLRVPLIAGVGFVLYQEPIDVWVFAGAVVIVAGIVVGLMPAQQKIVTVESR